MSRNYKKFELLNPKIIMRALRTSKCFSILFVFRVYIFSYSPFLILLAYTKSSLIFYPYIFVLINSVLASILIVTSTLSKRNILFIISLLFILYLLTLSSVSSTCLAIPCNKEEVISASGTIVSDVCKTKSGNYLIKMRVNKIALRSNTTLSAKGILVFLSKENYDLMSSTYIKADLSYNIDSDYYKGSNIQVFSTKKYFEFYDKSPNLAVENVLWHIRKIRVNLRSLIFRNIKSTLARLLLLGQCDSDGFIFKEAALRVGCSHLLALSGMHLSYISSFFSLFPYLVFRRKNNGKKIAKRISIIYPLLFVFIAGSLPSLIRSLFMYSLFLFIKDKVLKREIVFTLSLSIQLLLFPSAILEIGLLLSYSIIASLFILNMFFEKIRGVFSMLLATSVALIVSYPLGQLFGGSWSIAALVVAPLATFLISLAMACSLILLIDVVFLNFNIYIITFLSSKSISYAIFELLISLFGFFKHYLLAKVDYLEITIKNLFDWGIRVPLYLPSIYSGWESYKVFLITLLTILSLYLYSVTIIRYRRQRIYELEISIRFPKRNHSTT
ncbi:MAG: ComEC/Rec2 family competence protein [Spirochaetaceae bacterium]|nr:ComEC/Rec2 family competence protein [Spirochaetaceae bacterium]